MLVWWAQSAKEMLSNNMNSRRVVMKKPKHRGKYVWAKKVQTQWTDEAIELELLQQILFNSHWNAWLYLLFRIEILTNPLFTHPISNIDYLLFIIIENCNITTKIIK